MYNRGMPRDTPTRTIESGSIGENACAVTVHMRQFVRTCADVDAWALLDRTWGYGPKRDAGSASSSQWEASRRSAGDPRTILATDSRGDVAAVRV